VNLTVLAIHLRDLSQRLFFTDPECAKLLAVLADDLLSEDVR
jgi:hypothetical protein